MSDAPALTEQPALQITSSRRSRIAVLPSFGDLHPFAAWFVHLALVLTLVAVVSTSAEALPMPGGPATGGTRPLTGTARMLVEPLRHWDGYWYTFIADHGYRASPEAPAFWPLYPELMRAGHALTGADASLAGVVISNLALLLALVVLFRLVRIDYGADVARRTVWLLALFPAAFYFSAVYTEALFLLLTVLAVYLGRTARWGWAAVAAFLAGLTRNTGVLVLLPLGLLLIEQRGWSLRRLRRPAVGLTAALSAPLVYGMAIGRLTGDPLAPIRTQQSWQRHLAWPWQTVRQGFDTADLGWLHRIVADPSWGTLTSRELRLGFMRSEAYPLLIVLACLPLLAYLLWRLRPAYSVYALAALAIPLASPSASHPLLSLPRFAIVIFPLFIGLGLLLRNRWLLSGALALSTLQLAVLLVQFATWYWVA